MHVPAGVPSISQLLASSVWQWVVRPLLLRPLMQSGAADAMSGLALNTAGSRNSSSSRGLAPSSSVGSPASGTGHFRHFSWGSGSWGPGGSHSIDYAHWGWELSWLQHQHDQLEGNQLEVPSRTGFRSGLVSVVVSLTCWVVCMVGTDCW